jgi:hypothetical protein
LLSATVKREVAIARGKQPADMTSNEKLDAPAQA